MNRFRSERGAITVLVTLLLAGGVLLGTAALVVDVGQIYAEREQLQTGAEAAAYAQAKVCATTPAKCGTSIAAGYANRNAADGATRVTEVCGHGPGLPLCSAGNGTLSECIGKAPTGSYVEVRTATLTTDGKTVLPPAFARAFAGWQGKEVRACARAGWSAPSSGTAPAFVLSICEWSAMTNNGRTLPSADGPIYLHGGSTATCATSVSGWDAPGGFGWLDSINNCQAEVTAGTAVDGNTGASPSNECKVALASMRASGQPLMVPIYDGVKGTGASTEYHLLGFASFRLTGYALSGANAPSIVTGQQYCSGPNKCLYGIFSRSLVDSDTTGGVDLGAATVRMVG